MKMPSGSHQISCLRKFQCPPREGIQIGATPPDWECPAGETNTLWKLFKARKVSEISSNPMIVQLTHLWANSHPCQLLYYRSISTWARCPQSLDLCHYPTSRPGTCKLQPTCRILPATCFGYNLFAKNDFYIFQ